LEYLDQYHSARAAWKFNKNRETWILKHLFDETVVPKKYNLALVRYIHGLRGDAARERLKTQCQDLLAKEPNPEDNESDSTGIQHRSQDDVFRPRLVKDMQTTSDITPEYEDQNEEYSSWVQTTPRARLILWSLGLQGDTEKPRTEKPRAKKRKNRTAVVEYDSSSSDSSSDSSSSSESDSDSDSGTPTKTNGDKRNGDTLLASPDAAVQSPDEETSSSGTDEDGSDSDSSTDLESGEESS
jgi:20S proteasome subunit alpha 1